MKIAVIAALLFAVFITGNHSEQDHAQTQNVQNASNYSIHQAVFMFSEATPAYQQYSRHEKAKDYLKKAFGPEYLAAWILVLAAGIGLFATFRTLGILKDQTDAAKNAAKAALVNAQV